MANAINTSEQIRGSLTPIIKDNLDKMSTGCIQDIYKLILPVLFEKEYGIAVYTDNLFIVGIKYKLDTNLTPYTNYIGLVGALKEKGYEISDLKHFQNVSDVFENNFMPEGGNYKQGNCDSYHLIKLVKFLTGEDVEPSKIYNYISSEGIQRNSIFERKIDNITVETFKNGKVKLKGLNESQDNIIKLLYKFFKDTRDFR